MDGLRWLLLLFGLIVVLGVYFYSRRGSPKARSANTSAEVPADVSTRRRVPTLGEAPTDLSGPEPDLAIRVGPVLVDDPTFGEDEKPLELDDADATGANESAMHGDVEPESDAEPVPQKIVTLRLIAHGGGTFSGDNLVMNLRHIGMRLGKFGIFHRYDDDDEKKSIFCAASLVEPGSFDLANIKEQEIPGISLFAVLPGPIDGVEAFDVLMAAARTLAQSLDGELLDESGSTLSIQRERYMREEVVQYQHLHKIA